MLIVKRLDHIEEYKKLPDIQISAWKFEDFDVEPHYMMTRVQKYGGLVHGLFLDGNLIGFTYALIGKWEGQYFIYSHMAALKREHQKKGYGFILKKAQREECLNMSYDLIKWSFDPLEAMNSYFTLHRLGATSHEYGRNVYGNGECGLHKGLPTDRLVASWHLNSEHVISKMGKKEPKIIVKPSTLNLKDFDKCDLYIEIPINIQAIKEKSLKKAFDWQMSIRNKFEMAFKNGYVANGLVFGEKYQRTFYKLTKGRC
jgi:predicted GNAT superfamily acetyltransferase